MVDLKIDGFVQRIAALQEQVIQQDAALANDVRSQRESVNGKRSKVVAASRANRYTDQEG